MDISGWSFLDSKVKTLWRLGSFIGALVYGAMATGLVFFLKAILDSRFASWLWLIPLAVFLVTAILGQILVAKAFDCYRYRLGEDDIAVAKGIFWKSWRFVNRNRVQHVDLHAGPLARALGLVQINIYVGGMPHAAATIPGLSVSKAEDLRGRLIKAEAEVPQVTPPLEPPLG